VSERGRWGGTVEKRGGKERVTGKRPSAAGAYRGVAAGVEDGRELRWPIWFVPMKREGVHAVGINGGESSWWNTKGVSDCNPKPRRGGGDGHLWQGWGFGDDHQGDVSAKYTLPTTRAQNCLEGDSRI